MVQEEGVDFGREGGALDKRVVGASCHCLIIIKLELSVESDVARVVRAGLVALQVIDQRPWAIHTAIGRMDPA